MTRRLRRAPASANARPQALARTHHRQDRVRRWWCWLLGACLGVAVMVGLLTLLTARLPAPHPAPAAPTHGDIR
jgi:hypothetical protein